MKSMILVITEQIRNFYLIWRLSIFELKSEHSNNYLGMAWEVINPMIQIAIYFVVFGKGIHGRTLIHNKYSFLYWMLSGIVVWFFVNQATLLGSKSIYMRIRIMSRMKFPMSIIPSIVIASKFYQHLALTLIVFVILQFTPYHASIYLVQLPYFMFALLALLMSFTLITATLATIVRDVQMVVTSLMRVLLYLTPLLWDPKSHWAQLMMEINPLTYVVRGYRYSLLGGWYKTSHPWYITAQPTYTLYFWVVVLLMFLFGSFVHNRFKDRFVDYI